LPIAKPFALWLLPYVVVVTADCLDPSPSACFFLFFFFIFLAGNNSPLAAAFIIKGCFVLFSSHIWIIYFWI
jgi:hypothetical protein